MTKSANPVEIRDTELETTNGGFMADLFNEPHDVKARKGGNITLPDAQQLLSPEEIDNV